MKIAILQNRIGIGGRNVVIAEVIRICNRNGQRPTIFSFSSDTEEEKFRREYGLDLNFTHERIAGILLKRGTAYQTPLLNILSRGKIASYDVVFNSGRCPYFLPKGPVYIHYVHFPVEASLATEDHFRGLGGFLYTLPLKALYWRRARKVRDGIFLANSEFTASMTAKVYTSLERARIIIVYPPCHIMQNLNNGTRDSDVVSLGSLISDKRQLDQLNLARHFRDRSFHIIGSVKSRKYYQKCLSYIEENKLTNVSFHTDAPRKKVLELLSRSKIYLHTKHNEHFGISTVEAIGSGCLPLVHNSGGSREIVPFEKLRFNDLNDAKEIMSDVLDFYAPRRDSYMPSLYQHIKRYSVVNFHAAIQDAIFMQSDRDNNG